ncbi:MAG TPA: SDR family NAD(P)-dependent oxidoreductase [Polyangiaceae bacterium]
MAKNNQGLIQRTSRGVALVTGASSGIGRAIATRLAQDDFEVYGTSRKLEANAAGAPPFQLLELDVTSDDSVRACLERVLAKAGRIDVLVNNAGYLLSGAVEEVSLSAAQAQFETNFFGAARMIQAVLPTLRAQASGTIVNITSLAAIVPLPFWGFYNASKAALESLTETLREELRPFGIRVAAIEPGSIKTAFYAVDHKATPLAAYTGRRTRFEKTIQQFEQKAPGPELVARKVSQLVRSKSPPLHNAVTFEAQLFPRLRTWFPQALFELGLRSSFHLDDPAF